VLFDILHLEGTAAMQRLSNDEARRVERVGEHLVEGQVEGTRRGLVGHEDDDGLRGPLVDLHLSGARASALDVA
jgi:hypothetical protein